MSHPHGILGICFSSEEAENYLQDFSPIALRRGKGKGLFTYDSQG